MRWKFIIALLPLATTIFVHADPVSPEKEMKNKRVLISGAGIAGLTLAYWLKQYGFTPTIIEKHPGLRTGGQKVDIRGVAMEAIRRMKLYDPLFEARTDIQGASIVDRDGRILLNTEFALTGHRVEEDFEVMRGSLCRVLLDHAGDMECLFGDSIKQISQSEEGVFVEFEIGQPRMFDLVVGADGLHSVVRKLVFGDELQFLEELGLYVSVFTIPNFLNLDRFEIEYFEPHKIVNVFHSRGESDAKGGLAFSLPSLDAVPRNASHQQKLLEEVFADSGWEVPRLLAEMKKAPDFYFDSVAQVHMPNWSDGRVVLLGDAGYAPSPATGQGTSVAIVGAYVLAGELAQAHGNYKIAFSEYENSLRPFVFKNQELVGASVRLMSSSWLAWLTNKLLQILPNWSVHLMREWGVKRLQEAANAYTLKDYEQSLP